MARGLNLDVLESPFLKSFNSLTQTILFFFHAPVPGGAGLPCRVSCHAKAAAVTSVPAPHSLREGLWAAAAIVGNAPPVSGGGASTQDTPVTVVWGLKTAS